MLTILATVLTTSAANKFGSRDAGRSRTGQEGARDLDGTAGGEDVKARRPHHPREGDDASPHPLGEHAPSPRSPDGGEGARAFHHGDHQAAKQSRAAQGTTTYALVQYRNI